MNIRTDILIRVYLAFGLIVLFAFAVLCKLAAVQFKEGKKWAAMADSLSTRYENVEAVRGNIYSHDGSLLATSVPEYELHMDMLAGGIARDKDFYEKIDSLAAKLSSYFGDKSAKQYSSMLREARRDSSRYFLLKRKVTYSQLSEVRRFPIFNLGHYKGGLITVQMNKRILPFKALAARTIGYNNGNVQPVGLEGAYGEYINGETGKRLMQRIAGGVWMPVNRDEEIAAKDGADIISTIDVNMQDVAQEALRKQLVKYKADHGAVILMEVETGEVRAIANYTQVSEGVYQEKFNYAIAGNQDPGSTFKVASYMALLEDHKVDTTTRIATGNYQIPGHLIKDSHGSIGVVSVQHAFEQSSNAAIAKLINDAYHNNQKQFTDHLYDWGLNEKLELQIPGERKPVVKNPSNRSWNKNMTLPQMAYGYEMQMTPLKMLSFYNAIANDGKYIAPIFVSEIRKLDNTVEKFKARVIREQISTPETIELMQSMLESVVTNGTGKVVKSPLYRVAGKTGTAQVADGNKGYRAKKQYQSSFCGYFPADNPKYSLIVVINDPKGGYYAAEVAGPVFREIADKVYASDTRIHGSQPAAALLVNKRLPASKSGNKESAQRVYDAFGMKFSFAASTEYVDAVDSTGNVDYRELRYEDGTVPDLTGMGLRDAVYLAGNAGLRPIVRGKGKVIKQSVPPGSKVASGYPITLELR